MDRQVEQVAANDQCELLVAHILYLNGILPESSFKSINMSHFPGMKLLMMIPISDQSMRLIQWLDIGLRDAIKHRFLKELLFRFTSDPSGSSVAQECVFSFTYEAGSITMTLAIRDIEESLTCPASLSDDNIGTVNFETCRLLHMLVKTYSTKDRRLYDHRLCLRSTYHPHTPADYVPPTSITADNRQADVNTTLTHSISLEVCSTADNTENEILSNQMANMPVAMSMHPDTARDPGDEQPGNAMDIDQQTNESSLGTTGLIRHQESAPFLAHSPAMAGQSTATPVPSSAQSAVMKRARPADLDASSMEQKVLDLFARNLEQKLSVNELKSYLRAKKMPLTGRKGDLISRLHAHLALTGQQV